MAYIKLEDENGRIVRVPVFNESEDGTGTWHVAVCDSNGYLKINLDISTLLENPPTEDGSGKAPTSEWAFDHKANASAHHTKYTNALALAAAVAGMISGTPTDGQVGIWTNATTVKGASMVIGCTGFLAASNGTAAEKVGSVASGFAVCSGTDDDVDIAALIAAV